MIWSAFCKRFYGSTHRLYNIEPPQLCKQAISASPAERFRGIFKCWLHGHWLSASSTNNHINMIYVTENYISILKRHIIMRLLSSRTSNAWTLHRIFFLSSRFSLTFIIFPLRQPTLPWVKVTSKLSFSGWQHEKCVLGRTGSSKVCFKYWMFQFWNNCSLCYMINRL